MLHGGRMHWLHGELSLSGTSSMEKWLTHLPIHLRFCSFLVQGEPQGSFFDNSALCLTLSNLSHIRVQTRSRPCTFALSALPHPSSAQKSLERLSLWNMPMLSPHPYFSQGVCSCSLSCVCSISPFLPLSSRDPSFAVTCFLIHFFLLWLTSTTSVTF